MLSREGIIHIQTRKFTIYIRDKKILSLGMLFFNNNALYFMLFVILFHLGYIYY